MTSIHPPFHHSIFLRILVFMLSSFAFVSAQPERSHLQVEHFTVTPDDFLRAPLAVGAHEFENLTGIGFDSRGNFFVSDPKNMRTLRFKGDGSFLSEISWQKGVPEAKGKTLFIMASAPNGLLYAMEPVVGKRVVAYNDSGTIQKHSNYEQKEYSVWNYAFVNDHMIVARIREMTVFPDPRVVTRQSIGLINLDDWFHLTVKEADRREGGDFTDDFTNVVVNSRGEFFFGTVSADRYTISAHDKKGKPVWTMSRRVTPIAMKGVHQEEFVKGLTGRELIAKKIGAGPGASARPKPQYSAIRWLAVDSDDNLWVFTNAGQNNDALAVDLYNAEGKFRRSFYLDNIELGRQRMSSFLVRDRYLYAIVAGDGEKDEHVYRYALPEEIWR